MMTIPGIQEILSATGPIFTMIAFGFASVRFGLFPKEGVRYLGLFAVTFALPALLFKSISEREFAEIIDFPYLTAYGLGSILACCAVYFFSRQIQHKSVTTAAMYGMGGSISNTLMLGYPITLELIGPGIAVPMALTLLVENLIMLPLILAVADIGHHQKHSFSQSVLRSLPFMLKNPIILGILGGLLFSMFEIETPMLVSKGVDMFSGAVVGITLFSIGGMLVGLQVKWLFTDLNSILLTKLLLHPVIVLGLMLVVPGVDPVFAMTGVIFACMPMFTIYPIFGQRYNLGSLCAAALVPTFLVSFLTINLFIWILGSFSLFTPVVNP